MKMNEKAFNTFIMKYLYLLLISFLLSCSNNKQELYEEKMEDLQYRLKYGRHNIWIDNLIHFKEKFPKSLREAYLIFEYDSPEFAKFVEQHCFMDVFSKKREWIGYFPIYNSDDSEIISYLILSAGIDGKLDNINNPSNKLHLDDWKQKLNLYNPDEFDNEINMYSEDFDEHERYDIRGYIEDRPYSAKEEKSGNKDLLIHVHHLVVKYEYNPKTE